MLAERRTGDEADRNGRMDKESMYTVQSSASSSFRICNNNKMCMYTVHAFVIMK